MGKQTEVIIKKNNKIPTGLVKYIERLPGKKDTIVVSSRILRTQWKDFKNALEQDDLMFTRWLRAEMSRYLEERQRKKS